MLALRWAGTWLVRTAGMSRWSSKRTRAVKLTQVKLPAHRLSVCEPSIRRRTVRPMVRLSFIRKERQNLSPLTVLEGNVFRHGWRVLIIQQHTCEFRDETASVGVYCTLHAHAGQYNSKLSPIFGNVTTTRVPAVSVCHGVTV